MILRCLFIVLFAAPSLTIFAKEHNRIAENETLENYNLQLVLSSEDRTADAIYLKDGRVFRGKIIESSSKFIKIATSTGSSFTLYKEDIEKIVTDSTEEKKIDTETKAKAEIWKLVKEDDDAGFSFSIETGVNFGDYTGVNFDFTSGYHFNKYFYAGLGTGLYIQPSIITRYSYSYDYRYIPWWGGYDKYLSSREKESYTGVQIPIYAELKGYLPLNSVFKPYADLRLGYAIATTDTPSAGLFNIGLGVEIKDHWNISMGYFGEFPEYGTSSNGYLRLGYRF